MILEPRAAGDPITLQVSGRELYLLRAGMAELLNQIDDDELQTIIGTDRSTLRPVSSGLAELWATLDPSERRGFKPSS